MQPYQTIQSLLAQADSEQARELFQETLRKSVRLSLLDIMAEEVDALCGPKYTRDHQSECRRAGSEIGQAFINGTKEEIIRPRVRNAEGQI